MSKGFYKVIPPTNEPVKNYSPGSAEKVSIKAELKSRNSEVLDIPMYIGGEDIYTDDKVGIYPPYDHKRLIGQFSRGDSSHAEQSIRAAIGAKHSWEALPWEQRASIFLKAADLIAGPYRAKINTATMLAQSKNIYQAEIDSACELIDFLRFNVFFMTEIYSQQPVSPEGIWNRIEYRPLEGFVFAITPFNFTAIAGNLPLAPALMGNTVVWKPADTQIYSAQVIMHVLKEAGLPDGVINLIYTDGPVAGEVVFNHPDFGGLHFTGSTAVFQELWKTIGANIEKYKSYPRIVGETGGKDFILSHKSADVNALCTAIIRGAFEFQGQKCSAASRVYVPSNLWEELKVLLIENHNKIRMGSPEDFTNFVNAVIDERAFDKIASYLDHVKNEPMCEIIAGGGYDKSQGYFIEPTIVLTKDPMTRTMCEEIFGPVVTIYVYQSEYFEEVLQLVNDTSVYALTGAIFSQDRHAIDMATRALANAAGNFYVNDKPTGAVVGNQPFGGARGSGTNDKAGSALNLLRWVSPRTIKETFNPPKDFSYPFMEEE